MFLFYIITGNSQSTTVYTCKNNSVAAIIRDELEDVQAVNNAFLQQYGPMFGFTQANIIDDASNTYNCHAYAYHVSEGGNRVWINNVSPGATCDATSINNIDQYWEDGCIIQVANESDAEKIHYYRGDHSAIRLSSGMYQSKWGYLPLVRHAAADVDYCYPVSGRRYYAKFNIDGPDDVCPSSTATFSTPDYVNCTYTWTYDTNLLDYVSGQGTKDFTVEPKTSTSEGLAWVKLSLYINSESVTRERTQYIWVGSPEPGVSYAYDQSCNCQTFMPYVDEEYYFKAITDNPSTNNSDYYWKIYPPEGANLGYDYTVDYGKKIYFTAPVEGTYTFTLKQKWGCGWSSVAENYVDFYDAGFMMMMTPNPSTFETTLSIEPKSNAVTFDDNEEWELEVYSETQILKEKKTKLKGKEHKLKTAGWKEGVYFVRIKYKDEILQGKLVVKK